MRPDACAHTDKHISLTAYTLPIEQHTTTLYKPPGTILPPLERFHWLYLEKGVARDAKDRKLDYLDSSAFSIEKGSDGVTSVIESVNQNMNNAAMSLVQPYPSGH